MSNISSTLLLTLKNNNYIPILLKCNSILPSINNLLNNLFVIKLHKIKVKIKEKQAVGTPLQVSKLTNIINITINSTTLAN
jgi:hypothetical protein